MPVSFDGKRVVIRVAYNAATIDKIKSIPGRRWDSGRRWWTVPLEFLPQLRELLPGLVYEDNLEEAYASLERTLEASVAVDTDIIDPAMPGGTLRPYQAAGVRYVEAKHGRALIADEMGLGKTIMALAYIHRNSELKPVVVVCPASVKEQWRREAVKWLGWPEDWVEVLEGRKPGGAHREQFDTLYIINYDILPYWMPVMHRIQPRTVIIDESVFIKERRSKRSQAVAELAKGATAVIALSGRPVLNRPEELFHQLAVVRPDLPLGSWTSFTTRYAGYHKSRFGWEMGQAANLEELETRLRANIMIQRRKEQVLDDLPPLQRTTVPVNVGKDYKTRAAKIIASLRAERKNGLKGMDLAEITELRQVAAQEKLAACIEWIKEAVAQVGRGLVVFAHHHQILDALAHEFGLLPIDGRMPQILRQKYIDQFQAGDLDMLICGTRAMGMGVNLYAGTTCVFVELDWNMATHEQAESRLHRMGQTSMVNAYYLVGIGTIDEALMGILADKQEISEKIIGEEPTARVLDKLVDSLLEVGS